MHSLFEQDRVKSEMQFLQHSTCIPVNQVNEEKEDT